jgi:hypothetical protein
LILLKSAKLAAEARSTLPEYASQYRSDAAQMLRAGPQSV